MSSSIIFELNNDKSMFKKGYEYAGCVALPNGILYAIPYNANDILEFNPSKNIHRSIGSNLGKEVHKWFSGVVVNGCIYGSPYHADNILKVDLSSPSKPLTLRSPACTSPDNPMEESFKYRTTIVDPRTEIIYFIPFSAKQILKFDPKSETSSFIGDTFDGYDKWDGAYFSTEDNCIYCVPHSHPRVLKLNVGNDSTELIGEEFTGTKKWTGCVETNGTIYCSPCNSQLQFLKIDIQTGTTSLVGKVKKQYNGWCGCVPCMVNDNLYVFMIPRHASRVVVFNTTNESFYEVGPDIAEGNDKYCSATISKSEDCMYAFPYGEKVKSILKIDISRFRKIISSTIDGNISLCKEIITNQHDVWMISFLAEAVFDREENLHCISKILLDIDEGKSLLHEWVADATKAARLQKLVKRNRNIAYLIKKGNRNIEPIDNDSKKKALLELALDTFSSNKSSVYEDVRQNIIEILNEGNRAIDNATLECKKSMKKALLELALDAYSDNDSSTYKDIIEKDEDLLLQMIKHYVDNGHIKEIGPLCTILKDTPHGKRLIHEWVTNAELANLLFELVRFNKSIAEVTDRGRKAIEVAVGECRKEMERATLLCERFSVVKEPPVHCSRTSTVLKSIDCYIDQTEKGNDYVALKCMNDIDQVMAELKNRAKLLEGDRDSKCTAVMGLKMLYVDSSIEDNYKEHLETAVLACHIKMTEWKGLANDLSDIITQKQEVEIDNSSKVSKFMLVLDFAERSLATSIQHDQILDGSVFAVKGILEDIIKNVAYMHEKELIHGDLKPMNIVRVGHTKWKLIDLDVSCAIGKKFGSKKPSSGYCPPEVAKLISQDCLKTYTANVAFDLWSIGILVYTFCTGFSLFHVDKNDDIIPSDEGTLKSWNREALNTKLANIRKDYTQATNLLKKLLEPDPKDRKNHFKNGVQSILQDPFFDKQSKAAPKEHQPIHVSDDQFLVNGKVIDLPGSGIVTQSVAKDVCELVLYGARNGAGERKPCSGMIVIVGSKEQYEKIGYIQGENMFKDRNIFIDNWKENEEFVLKCFLQDLGLFVDGSTGQIMADRYKVDLITRDADHGGGSKHVSASAAGMSGVLAIKCSEDCCLIDGKGKGQLKIFSGVKDPVCVDVEPKNYSEVISRQKSHSFDSNETEVNVTKDLSRNNLGFSSKNRHRERGLKNTIVRKSLFRGKFLQVIKN